MPTTSEHRIIGLTGATMIGVGAIVGGGVLALAGVAFAAAGPAAILAFLINGVIAYLTAISYAEMASAFPENGGAYTFTKKLLSVQAAFGVGWILFFASIAAGVLYALGFAAFALEAIGELIRLSGNTAPGWLGGRPAELVMALGSVLFYTILLTRKRGGGGQLETIGKLVVFGLIIVAGFWVIARHPEAASPQRIRPIFPFGISGLITAMGFTFIALQGFDLIAAVAGEVKEPERVLPKAMFLSLAVALIVYMPLLFVIMTVGVPEGQTVAGLAAANTETMIAVAVKEFLGPVGFWLVMAAALLSMLSALFANLLAASRICMAMAKDRTLPPKLADLDAKRGIPVRAVLVSAGVLVVILLIIPNLAAAGAAASLIFLVSFTLTHLTAILARVRGGKTFGAFKAPWFPVLQVAGAICCATLAIFQGIAVPSAGLIISLWLGGGFIFYFTALSGRANVWDARSEAEDPELIRMRGRSPLVLVPLANPRHAKAMVEVANAMAPPLVGRVLLLSVMTGKGRWQPGETPRELKASQDVLSTALAASVNVRIYPEALVTMAAEPWDEIVRVANNHRCESLLLGLSDISGDVERLPIEDVLQRVAADVVIMKSADDWRLDKAVNVLVPISGGGRHDQLRTRLLSSLCRVRDRNITYLRIVKPGLSERQIKRLEHELLQTASEESPTSSGIDIVQADDPAKAIADHARRSDLVIVGTQRTGEHKAIGPMALAIARAAGGGVILISHRV